MLRPDKFCFDAQEDFRISKVSTSDMLKVTLWTVTKNRIYPCLT